MKKILLLFIILNISQIKAQDVPDQELLYYSPTPENEGKYYDIMYDYAPSEEAFTALVRYIEQHIIAKDWTAAVNSLNANKEYFPNKKEHIESMIEILTRKDEKLTELNIGSGVNAASSEIAPIQTADEKTLYFTSTKRDGFDNETDDIFFSKRVNDTWTPAEKLDAPFNSPNTEESPQGITTDGNTMVLFGNYKETPGGGDLYYAERTPYGWSEAIQYPSGINTAHFECDGKLTNDGKAFIFVSDRPGGIG